MSYITSKTPFGAPRLRLTSPIDYTIDRAINVSFLSALQPVKPNQKPFSWNIPYRMSATAQTLKQPAVSNYHGWRGILPWASVYNT